MTADEKYSLLSKFFANLLETQDPDLEKLEVLHDKWQSVYDGIKYKQSFTAARLEANNIIIKTVMESSI